MKNRFVRVTVVTIVVSFFYFTFFTEKAMDVSQDKNTTTEISDVVKSTIDTLLHEKGYLVLGRPNVVLLVTLADTSKHKDFYIIATDEENAILAKEKDQDNLEVYKKFSLTSSFKDYKVDVYEGKLADPDFETNPEAKMFITRIKEGCKEGINFAGHYTLIYWGCGTSCQYGVVVNRKTGEIIDGYQSSLGSEFRKNSKLIIFNSDFIEENSEYIPLYQFKKFELKLWKNNGFESL